MSSSEPILEVRNLKKYFDQSTGIVDSLFSGNQEKIKAIDGVSLRVHENESEGVIGESGCGKTTLLQTLNGFYQPTAGEIRYRGEDISTFDRKKWKEYRNDIQMIFQDPFTSMDPRFSVRKVMKEPMNIQGIDNQDERMREMLEKVELRPVDAYLEKKPDQLSGGELQRVSIARALITEPSILLADEPVSMLDVSIQASVLNLLSELVNGLETSLIYISHDISTVSYICNQVNVMYLGRIVESAPAKTLIEDPRHPYTKALINAVPIPDPFHERQRTQMKGAVSDPIGIGEGCRFRDRCPERMEICEVTPEYREIEENHSTACHLYNDNHDETAEPKAEPDTGR